MLNWINYHTFLYFMWCHDLIKTKVYYCMFFLHFIYFIPFKFTYWRTTAAAAVWCNIYLKHVFGTCYLICLLFLFMALENLHLMFLYVTFCITPGRWIKCFLWIFNVSPRVIVQVRIYLWQLSYSTRCIYVASNLDMLFSRLTSVEWETNQGKKIVHQRMWSSRTNPPIA